jgi:hypothetical protein
LTWGGRQMDLVWETKEAPVHARVSSPFLSLLLLFLVPFLFFAYVRIKLLSIITRPRMVMTRYVFSSSVFFFLSLFFYIFFFILNQSDLPNPESAWNFIIRLLSVSHFYLVSFPMLTSLSKFLFLFLEII